MNMQTYVHIGLLYFITEMKLFISIVLVLNIFLKKFIDRPLSSALQKTIKANIFQVQEKNSIMCGYFCIGFIDFMLAGKKLTDYTNLFSPYVILRKMIV